LIKVGGFIGVCSNLDVTLSRISLFLGL
jgi:hypothetical protein